MKIVVNAVCIVYPPLQTNRSVIYPSLLFLIYLLKINPKYANYIGIHGQTPNETH